MFADWDPLAAEVEGEAIPHFSYRMRRDINSLCAEQLPGILVEPDESDMRTLHALITGADGTPYEKGYFYFIMKCPADYPLSPPKVRLMTTGAGQVRFNPNLYESGKVCLSIIGTFPGPQWSCAQNLRSVLLSIQSIMSEKPYSNEPGYETERKPGEAELYNQMILHETIRVAVCGMIENNTGLTVPPKITKYMYAKFLENYGYYEEVILRNCPLSGEPMQDPLYNRRGTFKYTELNNRIRALRTRLLSVRHV